MPTARTELEIKLLIALKRISSYDPPSRLRKQSKGDWGLGFEEAIEMAYENIQAEAKEAVRGVRTAKVS